MSSSNSQASQDYYGVRQFPPVQQTSRNQILHPRSASQSQQNHGKFVGHGSIHASGYLQMPHLNGSYGTTYTAPLTYDTAESIQHDFDQYMRAAASTAPLPSTTHHSAQAVHPYRQQPPVMNSRVHPYPTYRDAHAPTRDYHGGKVAKLPASGGGKEPSSSTLPHPPVNKPYSKVGPVALPEQSRTPPKYEMIEDSRVYPSTSATLADAIIPLGLTNYVVVPQILSFGSSGNTRMAPIEFMPKGWYQAGIKIEDTGRVLANHAIEDSEHKVFSLAPGIREITIMILWPGYLHRQFEARIRTNDGNLTRGELLDRVCDAIVNFFEMLKERKTKVSRGDAKWLISEHKGVKVRKCFVAGLLHQGGNYFQPEIWVPCPREK